jgi:hypothetical protein
LQTVALSGPPNILVSTPACVATCISKGIMRGSSIKESLSMMILDEVHFICLLSIFLVVCILYESSNINMNASVDVVSPYYFSQSVN